MKAAAAQVRAELAGEKLAGLVNNAGVAVAGPLAGTADRGIPPPDRHQSHRRGHHHAGFCAARRHRSHPQGRPGPHRQYQFSRREKRRAVSGALRRVEIRAGRIVRKPAARAVAVRHRRHRRRAGRRGDADLEQSRADRHHAVSQYAIRHRARAHARLHAHARQRRPAARADRRGGAACADRGEAESAHHCDAAAVRRISWRARCPSASSTA